MADGPLPSSIVRALLDLGDDEQEPYEQGPKRERQGDDKPNVTKHEIAKLLMAVTPKQ